MIDLLPAPSICLQLGQRLRAWRLLRNLSQDELAARAGASLSAVRRLEAKGQGSLELVVRVAQALHGLGTLFAMPALTNIAQAEALAGPARRRASRRPAGAPR
jgi:transcriptional regulator with XRE-family HTH domain